MEVDAYWNLGNFISLAKIREQDRDELGVIYGTASILVEFPHGLIQDLRSDVNPHALKSIQNLTALQRVVRVTVDKGERLHQAFMADGPPTVPELQLSEGQLKCYPQVTNL